MAHEMNIEAQLRTEVGKNAARRTRARGLVPAIVYGGGPEPIGVELDPRVIDQLIQSESGLNTLIHLKVGERELRRMVLMRQVQRHPVTEYVTHVDFVRVELDKLIEVEVPIRVVGLAEGVKNEGGLMELVHRSIRVRVLPTAIPEHIDIDVTNLHNGQHVEAREVALPEGAQLASPPNDTLITIVAPGGPEESAAPAAAPETKA